MRKFIVVITLVLTAQSGWSQAMEVIIKNVNDAEGNVLVGLYSNETDFLKKRFASQKIKASKGEVRVVFENIPVGKYAISVFQDSNLNGELDKNMIGIPKEGFGFSNDAMGMFGPPNFEKASFDWKGEQVVSLTLKYY
ncbi:MAG TPA: DUF2141 domain-containing protein [Cyclobacteriaceae bacterium]|jgi:uncharacterized protein (DUF2141 family)|nr:DUF2141 domain-containing protein [Cyclobacteriaceae bacterium]